LPLTGCIITIASLSNILHALIQCLTLTLNPNSYPLGRRLIPPPKPTVPTIQEKQLKKERDLRALRALAKLNARRTVHSERGPNKKNSDGNILTSNENPRGQDDLVPVNRVTGDDEEINYMSDPYMSDDEAPRYICTAICSITLDIKPRH